MGKFLLIFRGENKRFCNGKYNDIRTCIPNNKVRIINSLRTMGHEVDIYFITYCSEYLQSFIDEYKPQKVFTLDYEASSQHNNFKFLLDSIEPDVKQYERVFVFRFDFLYKKNISEWPIWDNKIGHMFPWKDVSLEIYNERKYCMDGFFYLDVNYFDEFKKMYDDTYKNWLGVTNGLHFLTTELEKIKTIPFYFMEGENCFASNTSLSDSIYKNPYQINYLYAYYHDDYHLTYV